MKLLRALAAITLSAALLAGIPCLLAVTVGDPLDAWPALRAGDVSDRVVIALLGTVAYLAWAQFAIAYLVELVAALTRRPGPGRLPLIFGFWRTLAKPLIATALMIGTLTPSLVGPVTTAYANTSAQPVAHTAGPSQHSHSAPTISAPARPPTGHVETLHITATGPRTWWDLAAARLASGDRWPELWHLNAGATQSDGTVLHEPGQLTPGWRITVPTTDPPAPNRQRPAPRPMPNTGATVIAPRQDPPTRPLRIVTVQAGDTLSAIAQAELGDATRYPELTARNHLADPNELAIGQHLTLPDTATPNSNVVTVQPGDTLSGIAATHHLDDWTTLWKANAGHPQPGGQHLTDPNLIEPGWTLQLPTHPTPPSSPPPTRPAPPTVSRPTAPSDLPPATVPPTSHRAADGPPADVRPSTPVPKPHTAPPSSAPPSSAGTTTLPSRPPAPASNGGQIKPETIGTATTTTTTTSRADAVIPAPPTVARTPTLPGPVEAAPGLGPDHSDGAAGPSMRVFAIGGGALLAALYAGALLTRRQRQFRHRRPGRTIAPTPPDLTHLERALTVAAHPAAHDVTFLDHALRGLAQHAATQHLALPDLIAVHQTQTHLHLHLATPSTDVIEPWAADTTGDTWTLARNSDTGYQAERRDFTFAPYPMLASIGRTPDGDRWLVDLERIGTLHLVGDHTTALNLARFLAAELAHNTWSELLHITLVGFSSELDHLNPERVDHTTGPLDPAAAAVLCATINTITDPATILTQRLTTDAEPFTPTAILIADTPDTNSDANSDPAAELIAALQAHPHRTAVAVVTLNPPPQAQAADDHVGWTVTLTAHGHLHLGPLGIDLIAEQLPEHEAHDLARLLTLAGDTDDHPAPANRDPADWNDIVDTMGTIRPPAALTGPAPPRVAPAGGDISTQLLLPLPWPTYLARTATTTDDLAVLAPHLDPNTRGRLLADADRLDADLADWNDPISPRPKVTLLGPVDVRARGTLPPEKPRRAWNIEVVAYLATHPLGVTADEYGTALWPDDPNILGKTRLRQSVSVARKWLGLNPRTGYDYIPTQPGITGQLYKIDDVLLDADLFRRLRVRGTARGPAGITDLTTALSLVTGPPFHGARPGGYSWLADTPLHHEYSGMIVDVAHILATHHLANNDPDQAAAAAQVALTAGSGEDTPRLDLIKACYARNMDGEAAAHIKHIMTSHGAEVEEDLPPRTYEVLRREGWLPQVG